MTDLLTTAQVGNLLGCSARTVARMADAGKIPVAMTLTGPNGSRLFDRSVIEDMLTSDGAA